MGEELYFRSTGLIKGTYLPSSEDVAIGSIITEQGIFPAELDECTVKFFNRCAEKQKRKKQSGRPAIAKEHNFICWVYGLDKLPYYKFRLVGRIGAKKRAVETEFSKLLPEDNFFITKGVIIEKNKGEVIQRIQKNYHADRTNQEIAESANDLKIVDCPGKVRNSQFWEFKSSFSDGLLHCQSAKLLAYAKEAKKLLIK